MKWMDRPIVTEIKRGGVYEMEIEISSFHFCDTWSVHLYSKFSFRRVLVNMKWITRPSITEMNREDFYFYFIDTSFSISVTLGLSIHFIETSSITLKLESKYKIKTNFKKKTLCSSLP